MCAAIRVIINDDDDYHWRLPSNKPQINDFLDAPLCDLVVLVFWCRLTDRRGDICVDLILFTLPQSLNDYLTDYLLFRLVLVYTAHYVLALMRYTN